jgi:hypothetical protein
MSFAYATRIMMRKQENREIDSIITKSIAKHSKMVIRKIVVAPRIKELVCAYRLSGLASISPEEFAESGASEL